MAKKRSRSRKTATKKTVQMRVPREHSDLLGILGDRNDRSGAAELRLAVVAWLRAAKLLAPEGEGKGGAG